MPDWITIFAILVASFSLGWLIACQFGAKRPFPVTPLEFAFASLTMGIITIGWLAFVLAEIGQFSILILTLLWAGSVLFLLLRMRRNKINWQPVCTPVENKRLLSFLPNWVEYAALSVWLITAVFLFLRPHQFITGGADAGVYINL